MRLYSAPPMRIATFACTLGATAALAREPAAEQVLDRCLGSSPTAKLISAPLSKVPLGMSRKADVLVEMVETSDKTLFTYQGASPREVSCGIAIYGPVSQALRLSLKHDIEGYAPRWTAHVPGPYVLGTSLPGQLSYWGAPKAPGITGVLWIERKPSANAPTLEIDYHTELIS